MIKIENHSALTWYTSDIRDHLKMFSEAEQERFYEMAGHSDRDLRTYFECILDERADRIIEFINNEIADAVQETLDHNE
jgi:hypothetical protein